MHEGLSGFPLTQNNFSWIRFLQSPKSWSRRQEASQAAGSPVRSVTLPCFGTETQSCYQCFLAPAEKLVLIARFSLFLLPAPITQSGRTAYFSAGSTDIMQDGKTRCGHLIVVVVTASVATASLVEAVADMTSSGTFSANGNPI
jgi:hypothetical protein